MSLLCPSPRFLGSRAVDPCSLPAAVAQYQAMLLDRPTWLQISNPFLLVTLLCALAIRGAACLGIFRPAKLRQKSIRMDTRPIRNNRLQSLISNASACSKSGVALSYLHVEWSRQLLRAQSFPHHMYYLAARLARRNIYTISPQIRTSPSVVYHQCGMSIYGSSTGVLSPD